ncbi:MAG: ORF6N domain-containing protein, partial [Sulfuricurvum sp.]
MEVLPSINIQEKIHFLRNTEVMLDSDLAELYGVETKRINEAVKNNPAKFPDDFMFECTQTEWEFLRSKFSTLDNTSRGQHRKYLPKAFSEQGVYMLATILKSQTATEVTISIMRTFTKLRHYALEHTDLSAQISEIRQEVTQNKQWTKDRMSAVAD